MWSFPLMSLFFGLYSWRNKNLGAMVIFLLAGLGLQLFSYDQGIIVGTESRLGAVIFGRALLLSFLINIVMGFEKASFKEKKERVMLKMMPLTAMCFFTANKFLGNRVAEALMAGCFLLLVALFWSHIRKFELATIASFLLIPILSFTSFMLTWADLFQDRFFLNPLLWMIAFSSGFFILISRKEASS